MAMESRHADEFLQKLLTERKYEELRESLRPSPNPTPSRFPGGARIDEEALERRWQVLGAAPGIRERLADPVALQGMDRYRRNIENFIGIAAVPIGVAGPLRVHGLFAQGDYYVPLATTEAALVASYCRGAYAIALAGGCTALLLNEGVSRAPGFAFETLVEAGEFAIWSLAHLDDFKRVAEATTHHGRVVGLRITIEGNHVYLNFEMTTGDAAGQNMVTIATNAICQYIEENSPIRPRYFFVEANLSGDKKASWQSFTTVRGKKVSAEVALPEPLVKRVLHTTPERMVDYWRMSAVGGVLSGCIGVQGHYANGLAAMFLATGQDVATVAEAAVGVTRMELNSEGGLYATVTLPNLIVGSVGGGTGLPTQQACLELMNLAGEGKAQALAEVCAALALAGELSIVAALSCGEFTRAHQRLARGRQSSSEAGSHVEGE